MKKLISLLFLGLFALSCAGVQRAIPERYISGQENVLHLRSSVVALVNESRTDGLESYCTAFFIRPTLLATAAHCLSTPHPTNPFEEDTPAQIGHEVSFITYQQWSTIEDVDTATPYQARLIQIDRTNDVALLRTVTYNSFHTLKLRMSLPRVGEQVYSVSFPGGLSWVLSEGIVSTMELREGQITRILASPPIFFGSSGGPLIDNSGRVIGIAHAIGFRQSTFGVYHSVRYLLPLRRRLTIQ